MHRAPLRRSHPRPPRRPVGGPVLSFLLVAVLSVTLSPSAARAAQGVDPCAPVSDNVGEISYADFGTLTDPAVAVFGDGAGIVVFTANQAFGDGSSEGILGIFVDAAGQPVGDAFVVNTFTDLDQFEASVAAAPDGRFVVVWESDASPQDADGQSIRGRLFGADGLPSGSDFQINDATAGDQIDPQVAMADDGSFVVTWESEESPGNDDDSTSVQARRFGADGAPRGAQFQVNTIVDNSQGEPDVGVAPDGSFVIVFSSRVSGGSDTNRDSVQARRYAANGQPLGAEQQVNVTTALNQNRPRVAVDADGSYLVVWQSDTSAGNDDDSRSVQARGFAADGSAAGGEVQVNQEIFGGDELPDVAPVGGREFLVVWVNEIEGDVYDNGAARAVTLTGQLLGPEIQVSPRISRTAVAGNRRGDSLVASRAISREGGIVGQGFSHPCANSVQPGPCVADAETLCLNGDRFRVTLAWRNQEGQQGVGRAVELTQDTGYFWIFDAANVEVVIKLLNACTINDRFWVFAAGLTDLEVELRVEDTRAAEDLDYGSPLGVPFQPVTDTSAFATCP